MPPDVFAFLKKSSHHTVFTNIFLLKAGMFLKKEKYLSPSKPKEFQIKNEFPSDCKIQVKKEILEGFNSTQEEKPYKCEACNATFTQRKSLNRHTAWVHQGKKPHKCDICQATFGQKSNLDSHIASSHDDLDKKPFKCETCPSAFDKRYKLKYHIDCVHEKKKPFSCKECYYSSAYKHDLKRHYESMHEGIRYKCDSCTSSFTEKSSLKTHVLFVHNGYRPFNCKFCEGTFSKKAYLERHQSAVHDGHRPFKCGFCESTFSAKQFLERHEDSVHKDKPDFYNLSPKVPMKLQRDTQGMKKEVPTNSGEGFKPFKCDSCEGTFSKKEFLERHRAAIHKKKDMRILSPKKGTTELPRNPQGTQNESLTSSDESSDEEVELFKCDSCEGSFSKKENLEKHQATVHKGKQDSGNLGSNVPMELTKNTPGTQTELPTSSDESSDDNSDDEIKPFKCDSCEGTFSKKEFLDRHQAAIHKGRQDSRNLNPKKSLELTINPQGNPKSSAETSNDLQSSQEGSKELPTTILKPSKELS